VLEASGADEALRIADTHHDPIDLLLTDINTPGMRGPELAARIAEGRPGIRIVFISGSGAQATTDPGVVAVRGAVLQKPFGRDQLAKALWPAQQS
jgi:CheY-like chemotaxis protein